MGDGAVLEFGSRSGSYAAAALFAAMFAAIAFGACREISRRAPNRRRAAWFAAAPLVAGALALLYATSLNGFYEAEVRNDRMVLHYLYPVTAEIPLRNVTAARASPAFKGRWRLHVTDVRGAVYESATSSREVAMAAADQVRSVMRR